MSSHGTSCAAANGRERMRHPGWADEIAKISSWTCRRCLRGKQKSCAYFAPYTTNPGTSPVKTISVQRISQIRQSSVQRAKLEDVTLHRTRFISSPSSGYMLKDSTLKSRNIKRGVILAIFAFGSIWAFSDDAKHRYVSVKRASRVFYALVRCLREYVLPSVILHLWRSRLHI